MAFGRLKVDELETSTQTVSVDALASGGVSDGDKGDITVSGTGTVWTIDAGVVDTSNLGGDITIAGKALLDDADAAAQRTTLGLATVASTGAYSDLSGTPTLVANLNDLGDVDLTTTPPADGEALVYDSATGDWVPGAAGGGGTPGGTTGQIQWNSSGSFAGIAGSAVGASGDITLSLAGAASTPPVSLTGTWFSGGTGTTTKPQLLIEPSGTTSTTWSTSGTGLGVNAASGFAGNLLDLQVDGSTKLAVDSAGTINDALGFGATYLEFVYAGTVRAIAGVDDGAAMFKLPGSGFFGWAPSTNIAATFDLALFRDDAGILAQRNGTSAQTYRLYNTFTDASNYERAYLRWASNVLEFGTEGAGTGSERPVRITAATLKLPNLPTYADNTTATSNGLVAGDVYKTATGELRITV